MGQFTALHHNDVIQLRMCVCCMQDESEEKEEHLRQLDSDLARVSPSPSLSSLSDQ